MRTGSEARDFFVRGRAFMMLWAETASETWARQGTVNTAITVGRFGEKIFSQIRRFIVVKVEHGFVYAIAIYTYTGRGTLKPGCIAREHAVVFLQGSEPTTFSGETDGPQGMNKEPIEIVPADDTIRMDPASRVRFGKTYSIEWNVKVKDMGRVSPKYLTRLYRYWSMHMAPADDPDVPDDAPIRYGSNSKHTSGERPDDSAYTTAPVPQASTSTYNIPRSQVPPSTNAYQPNESHPTIQPQYLTPYNQQPNNPYQNPYQNVPYQVNHYEDNHYQTNQYQANQYQANQYQNNPYQNNQYQNNPYQNNQYPNNQYPQYPYHPPQ